MKDPARTKQKLIEENALKQRIQVLEKSESERKLAEEALQESERHMKLALEGTDQGLWEWDILSRKVVYDENWQRIMNLPSEGRYVDMDQWLASMDAGGRAAFEIKMTDYLADRERYYEFEHRLQTKNKDWKWIWTRGIATERDPSGIPLRMIGTYRDITKHKQAEEALRESENLYRTFINATADMVFLKDELLRNVVVNKSFAAFFGKIEGEIIGKNDFELMPQTAAEKCRQTDMEAMSNQIILTSEEIVGDQWFETVKFPVELGRHRIGVGGFIRDITERKRAEDDLRESEEKYRTLSNNILDIIYSLDKMGNILAVNRPAGSRYGYETEMSVGKPFLEIIHPDDREMVVNSFLQAMEDHREYTRGLQFRIQLKDGAVRWMELNSHMRFDEKGLYLQEEGVLRDITERRQLEEEKRSMEERLQLAEKMEAMGLLAGGVAHDLNNVLGIVVGYAELVLMNADKSSSIRPQLVNIMNGGLKAAAIVDDLLTLARRGVSGREVLNLNKIIADCHHSPEFANLSSHHPYVKIKMELDADLLNISCSSIHLGKSLFNLVSNASEAMPKGGCVTIGTANQYIDKPIHGYDQIREGDYVVLSVSDTGDGISADNLKRIFEPFYTKKVMGRSGTGLGLAVVWGTVKDHHGYINVESEEGKGSTFTLYFPVTREYITPDAVATAISEYMGSGESILVVDDVKEQRDLASGMLRTLNYNVASVESGEEAIAYLREHQADLIILDMIMDPGMDGLDTYKQVLGIHPQQKAIIVSGFSESDRVRAARGLGAGAYVRKPYIIEKLGMAVRKEIDRAA